MILILIPTLNRPDKLRGLAENIREATRAPHEVLYIAESGDAASHEEGMTLAGEGLAVLAVNLRKPCYAGAVNTGYAVAAGAGMPFTHVFLGADDVVFRAGWDEPVLDLMKARPEVQAAGTNDLHDPWVTAGKIASHYLVARAYIDEAGGVTDEPPGIVLCEKYEHASACAEFHETACSRGAWAPCLASIVEHHPYPDSKWHQPGLAHRDGVLFNARRHLWDNWRSRSYLISGVSHVPD